MQRNHPPLFYGWKLGLLASLGNFLIQGSAVYLMNAFIEPFTALYGWNRGDMGLALGIGSFCGMGCAPFLASLSMRFSLRYIMTLGAVVGGITLFMLARFTNLWLFTVNLSLLWIAGQACGGVIANALMSNWFIASRGRAFGMVNFGVSFSGAILPFVALVLLKTFSVQTASAILGSFALFVLAPAVWVLVRDTPESIGLTPDGTPLACSPEESPAASEPSDVPNVADLLRSPLVWRIGLAFGILLLTCAGVVGQLKPRFSDLGFSDFAAMSFMCATAFFTASGKYLWGWICDRYPPITVSRVLCIVSIGAYLLAFLPPNLPSVIVFTVVCGVTMGGYWTCLPAVVVNVFGRKHFMAVYRVVGIFIFLKSAGYIIMGKAHQLTGNYDAAFLFFCCLFVVAFLLLPKEGTQYRGPQQAHQTAGANSTPRG